MQATLTITADLSTLSTVAAFLDEQFAGEIDTEIAPTDVFGYTTDTARYLYDRLAARQRDVLRLVVDGDGRVDLDALRGAPSGSFRGLTGPISKWVKRLVKTGVLPEGTKPPTTTIYDHENRSSQRAKAIVMDPALVAVFAEAIAR